MANGRPLELPRGALAKLRKADPALGEVIDRVGPCRARVGVFDDPLEALVRAIVGQQLSGKAAATIYARFRALYDADRFPAPERILGTHHARLRKAGLSRQKQAAVRDLCKAVRDDRLQLGRVQKLDDETLTEQLAQVRGIGRWSAQMFMMFHLGRPDVWAPDDLGIKKAIANLRGLDALPTARQMIGHGERYAPLRTAASWYLWRSLELA